ncbi:tetratricopeptide repeat protein [Chthonobacter albigriseus]|uniref:tetratricopeptide repeat protein n=1 Tax=Chthonobacter albigriseus TaxID=1683161 RepID=UPI0015EEF8DF|nr:tetratricopeptide repeat protein [Chthonobacter albigriseus]
MVKVERVHILGLASAVAATLALSGPAAAFDVAPNRAVPCCDVSTEEVFREGTRAYYAGDTATALDGLQIAAEKGHPAAQWKLGRMYAAGDGVAEDDLKAFEYFNQIVAVHAEDSPTSPQAPFIANAFVEIGSYYLTGIANSGVEPNVGRAREIFTYAASYFGDALAQTKLGDMYFAGVGGERDPRQAARWFLLAARKGQVEAQARLGQMLFFGEEIEPNPVHGLMWLTIALKSAQTTGRDDGTIRAAHEQAFSLANEDLRRKATQLADQWLQDNASVVATAAGN